jgi:hypothetical protein
MRLINADDILSMAHDVILQNGAKHRCFDVTMLHEIPKVEAIPIEFIQQWIDKQNYGRRNGKMMLAKALNELIAEWRKEHETG